MQPPKSPIAILFFCLLFSCGTAGIVAAGQVPHEVGGFALGSNISDYPYAMNTNYLKEMVITDMHGFRKGTISYGICKYPDTILKIELKYENQSRDYYENLLNRYKRQFGEPQEWKGDSFGILYVWKWHFVDDQHRQVSLTLQHNLRNTNETIGNMVRLAYPDLLNEERECFNHMYEQKKSEDDLKRREEMKKPDWQYLIPR